MCSVELGLICAWYVTPSHSGRSSCVDVHMHMHMHMHMRMRMHMHMHMHMRIYSSRENLW